jgi:hypothetical protein
MHSYPRHRVFVSGSRRDRFIFRKERRYTRGRRLCGARLNHCEEPNTSVRLRKLFITCKSSFMF